MRRGRIHGEKNMRNSRTKTQTKLRNYIKLTAGALLLAITFVLVFAGTLSGAFGIENELQQNGIIQSNVASAAYDTNPQYRPGSAITVATATTNSYTSTMSNINLTTSGVEIAAKYNVSSNPNDNQLLSNFYQSYGSPANNISWVSYRWGTKEEGFGINSSGTEDDAYVYWLEFKFDEKIIAAIRNVGVSFYASATGRFDNGKNDEYAFAISYIGEHAAPTYAIVNGENNARKGDGASWSGSFTNAAAKSEWVNGGQNPLTLGNNGYSNSYKLTNNTTGIRMIFAAIADGELQGGFLNISCKLFLGNEKMPITVSPSNAGTVSNTELSGFSNIEDTKTVSFKSANDPYYFSNWSYKDQSGNVNTNSNASLTVKPYYSDVTAQYKEIPFVFNGTPYATYNPITKLVVLENTENYMSSQIDGYDTSITYQKDGVDISSQPKKIGTYTATITVKKGGVVRGTRTVEFEVVEGDFGKIQGGTGKWGSVTNPYVISNETHLKNLSAIVNGRDALNSIVGSNNNSVTAEDVVATDKTYKDCYFVVAADLGTADAQIALVPIGKDSTHYFAGTIFGGNDSDANNRTMRTINLNIQQSGVSNVGLFGYVKGASISYIKTAGTIVGGNATGGLVGCMENGEVFNCANSATVTGRGQVGGIVGYNLPSQRGKIYGTIINNGAINGTNMVGGLVGQWHGEWNLNGTYGTFTNTGNVNGGTGASVGGIAGFADRTIKNAANSGNVVGGTSVGGIAGRCQAPIENSYNTGDVRGTATTSQGEITGSPTGVFVGGITGYTSANASISNCYNTGHISALSTSGGYLSNANYVGGIVGFAQAAVSYCANIGGLIEGNDYLGGIVGNSSSTIDHCYDVQGQRKHRYDTGRIGAISGYGGTATNSWAINAKANDGSTCSNPNPTISNVGKVFVSVGDVAPAVIDGYTEKVWTDILTININGFKATATVNNGKFLASATASNGATSVVPAKIDGALTANANGASAQQTTDATLTYWYNANTSSNIYVQIKDVGGVANSKTYNGANQTIDNVSASPFTATAFYFDANYAGTATDGKMNAGTYSVIVDVVVDGNVVGRKLFGSWTINTRIISQNSSSATYYYGARILSPDIADILSNIVNGHSVTSDKTLYNFYDAIPANGSRTYTITYTNIRIVANGSDVTGNYKINNSYTFTITVNEGDFGVYGTTDIEKNPWGSVNNPYVIRTQAQLERLSVIVASGSAVNSIYNSTNYPYVQATDKSFANAYFVLDGNISMSEQSVPIGNSSTKFSGTFDGKNHTISNFKTSGQYSGLFGYVNGARIQNLTVNVTNNAGATSAAGLVGVVNGTTTIRNCTVNGTISGTHQVGGFVGFAQGVYQDNTLVLPCNLTIEGCINNATVTTTSQASDNNRTSAGGFVGYVNAGATVTIKSYIDENGQTKKSTNNGKISTTSSADNKGVGGFVGYSYGKITLTDCVNEKNATITGKERVGGLVGYIGKADSDSQKEMVISGCENKATVTSNSTNDVYGIGGIVGYNSGHKVAITNCINSGAITGTHETAGIIGYSDHSEISNCTNSGAVSGFATVGGIVGKMGGGSIVSCKNTATVKASKARDIDGDGNLDGAYLGGIAGWTNGNVNNCYNSGTVTTETSWGYSNIVGGIVGFLVNGKTVSYCYNSGTIVGSSQIGGIIGYLTGALTTVTYCYHSGRINSVWNENNVAKGSLGYITGNDTSVLDSCWILPGASTDSASSTKIKTNGRKLEVGQYRYVPAIIDDYSTYGWTDILTKNINGFRVQESVNPGASQFFESKKGSNSTTHLTPNKTESSNQANALIRDNTDSFTITAWYGANTASDIYCAVNTIAIDISADTYNNAQLGFTRSDVTTPGTSGSVYGIVFDYKGKNHNEIFVCAFDSNGNIVAGSTNPTQVDTYNTTVFVKIGDIVVGKKIAVDYTIDKAALNVGWEWTDKLHANLYDRTGNGDKVQFVYNGKAQGLDSVSEHLRDVQLFDVTGNDLTNTNAATYTRTYTLKDTRNYKLQNANNNNADLSGTTVTFEWKIRKNKLTVFNRWVAEDFGKDSNLYTFEYNTTHRGLLTTNDAITFLTEKATDNTRPEFKQGTDYTISEHQNAINVGEYSRTVRIINTNYEVNNTTAYVGSSSNATVNKGISVNGLVVTYTWKIVPYSLATNITSGNVWFGGRTDLIVGNQGIANVNVGNQSYADKRFYPLQSEQNGVQKVLVYAQHNYAADKFVLYVKYNNGTVAVLTQGTEYTLSALDAPTVENPAPLNTSVTASGTGNFSGDITKYYTALYSDFGGNVTGANWGSAKNPYVISKPEHLLRLSQIVNGGMAWNSIQNTVTAGVCIAPQTTAKATSRDYKDAYFLVTDDIDMSGYISTDGVYNFLPIGHRNEQSQTDMPFSGTFDGNGKIITYLYNTELFKKDGQMPIGARVDYVGLFGYLKGATVQNVNVTSNALVKGGNYVGLVAGYAKDSKLSNVFGRYGGTVEGTGNYVGGIVGYADNTWLKVGEDYDNADNTWLKVGEDYDNAITNANVAGMQYVGGIVGKWIVRSEDQIGGDAAGQAKITLPSGQQIHGVKYVGGLVGWLDTSSCTSKVEYTPQLNNNGEKVGVYGTEYVGALFGAFIGNGYHQNATNDKYTAIVIDKYASDNFKVGNVKVILQNLNEQSAPGNAKVVGGLVGYAEGVGILFNTDWTTSNVTLDTGNYTPSFIGGIAGVLGKNATIESKYQLKDDGTFLSGGLHTITNNTELGASGNLMGSFVGGIVGYVSSQAGVYWETGTTIFGNGISLVNSATIYATSYAGGIFGALGDIPASVAKDFESDSILYKVLTTGVREGSASTTLGLAPTVSGNGITAQGRLVNNASISVSGSYVGGIAGYGGAKVRFVLRNTPQDSAIDVSKLNIYSGGSDIFINGSYAGCSDIFINGSYAGGIAGYLVDNLEHDLQYIVVKAKFNQTNQTNQTNQNATHVGGLVGYMGSGNVQNCVVINSGSRVITESTDTYKGKEYVGGLVGETQNATIRNSVSTGFNLEKTSNTKGGLLGGGTNPTIDSSWTFYIANSGATYSTVSKNTYGKYILVDTDIVTTNGSSYPTFENLCGFTGITKNGTAGVLEFAVNVPSQEQLVFYNASGSDTETSNKESFKGFENRNNVLTIKLDMASGTSMQICLLSVRFVNVPKCSATSTEQDKIDIVEATYVKPSNSTRYHVKATTADFDTTGTSPTYQVTHIVANIFFDYNGDMVYIGTAESSEKTGSYDSGTLTPGHETNPYTISTRQEWEDFAASVNDGSFKQGSYVKLLNDITISTLAGNSSNSFSGTFDGNGHTINLGTRGDNADGTSLFPYAYSAVFRNLSIDGTITNTSREGLAGFVGIAKGKLEFYNCTNNVKVTAFRNAAGFTGFVSTYDIIFTSCVNNGDIETKEGADNSEDSYSPIYYTYGTGGIIACIAISGNSARSFTIKSCINNGNITAPVNVGGIVGKISGNHSGDTISARCDLYMYDCANTGEIYSNQKLTDDQAGAFWDLTGDNKYYGRTIWCNAGGLVGIVFKSAALHLYSSYNSGYVHGIGNVVGGLVGSIGDHNGQTYRTPNSRAMYPSEIYYCFNTGRVEVGYDGVNTSNGINIWGKSGDKYCSAVVGGLVGVMSYGTIAYSYNTGTVDCWGGVGVKAAYNSRAGGIIGESTANAQVKWTRNVTVKNCYNVGQINVYTKEDARYASGIVGYMDADNAVNNTHVSNCYSVTNAVYYRQTNTYIDELIFGGDEKWTISGTLSDLSGLTAKMNDKGVLTTTFAEGSGNDASIESLTDDTKYINGTAKGYIYIYGCLPQLAVFALDTHDALSMRSVGFGQDQYGEFNNEAPQNTGSETYPYIIRDGIGLLGVQALVDLGYDFDNEYIEFANSTNNIKADGSTSSNSPLVCTSINMPKTDEQNTYLSATAGYYMSSSNGVTYNQAGKSYHLFALGAVCRSTPGKSGENSNDSFNWWIGNNHYYNGAYGNKEGAYKNYATFKTQNILTIGRNGNVFKGSISGKQVDNDNPDKPVNTVINNLRIMTGKTNGGAYAGLFGHIEDAYVGYIEVGGESNIWSFSYNNSDISVAGGVVAYMTGGSVVEHCVLSGTASVGAYGIDDKTNITTLSKPDFTYAGGIVGLADPKQGSEYKAGISAIIKGCTVNISTTTGDRAAFAGIIQACKSNIGGVLGYIEGIGHIKVDGDEDGDDKDYGASGKSNSVRIEGCSVDKAVIQAASSANTSSQIGGILGYGSEFVAAFITGCEVGNSADTTDTVTIKGEHSLGGIAGGMSNAKGGYIDSCTVGANTTIERIDVGGDKTVLESENHGTAIGGLVGFTQNSNDDTSPLTTTFSGTSAFNGTITVSVEATNKSQDSDAKISCIGGIVGDMGSGASFASGSDVTVGGTIDIKNSQGDWLAAANIGGVAGRTSNATFIGKFDVSPTMNTLQAENVGGFIGKNVGTVYILADTTERIVDGKLNGTNITIGGTIQGTSEVGGFIGVNNSGSSLNIGSNVANAKPYRSGTLSITIAKGAEISGSGDNVGGIVGKNEGADGGASYATIDIVKGTITQQGTINGANNVGGIIGLNDGLLTTGGGEADTSIGGIALSDDQIGLIKNLSITNIGNVTGSGNYVGGVVGKLDSPSALRTEDSGKGAIAGTFTNSGKVVGNSFVGGSLGFVGKNVTITAKNNVATLFVNDGQVTATGYFVGGSIGALVGKIQGENSSVAVKFENKKKVNATGFVGGSIGVLAGPVSYAQFVNSSDGLEIAAVNSVGGSVGYIGVPSPLSDELVGFTAHQIDINNTHFEASGNLTANPSQDAINAAKKDKEDNGWGGVGGAIGVMGAAIKSWTDNTYYANGNVNANVIENGIETGIYNVGGIVGLINAGNITISNMLAYRTTVTGGKNVGGIVGATNGTNTKILSAYTIEGTFSGTENVGGIIGLANSTEGVATDAKTSYWVKGYSNAVLAGADVKDLQQTLGKFETIVEQVTVEGKQQSIVFTEDFCKLYTPKTYYADYPGTHTYNGETVTPGENVEQLTWYDYFKDKLGETSAQIKNGAWVKTVANAVTFTTGTEKTGWYFAFANDATGTNGLGTINTNHQGGGDYELKYWKRIANAYTAQERADKEDKKTLDPPSDIVSGGQPQHATLYATATAAGEDSGYYLYMATSGQSRPTATYSTNKFFIQVLTTTTTQAELAQNVAIYYRTISKGKTLTYNGYLRYAPVGITVDDGKTVPYVQTPQQDATKKDSYCYSADTTTGGNAMGGAQIDPGNYESAVKIYYYDKDGKPYVVGGVSIKWEIKARQLSADIKSDPHRVYGDNRNQDDGHDMKVVISNIAPGAGTPPHFVITVTDKSSNPNVVTTFEYNGNTLSETKNGITLTATSVGTSSNNGWEASDNLYNVEEPTDKNTKEVLFYIDFTNAKTYEVSVAMKQGDWTKRYTLDAKKDFSVNPAELRLTRSNPASEKYDGTAKSATWFISGFKYQEGAKEFAAFQPQFKTALGKTTDPKVVTLYDLYKGTATSGYTLETNITLGRPGETVSYGEKVENQSKTISYTLSGATQAGDYSIVFPSTGSSITVGNYILKFYEGASPQTKPPVFSIAENKITISISYVDSTKQHSYNGQKKGEITITFKADNEIAGYGDYISNFFKVSINNDGKEISKPSGTTSGKTAQWVFETGVDAKEYKVTISDGVNHTEYVKNCAHDAYPNNIIYKITKAPLTVEFVQTDPTKTTYEYNTYHQGLKKVKLSGLWQNANNNSNMYDSVDITVNFDNKAYSVTIDHNDSAVDIKGIDTRNVGNYTATISNSVGGTRGSNYYISNSSVSTSWKITPHELKLGGLEQDGTKIYDGAAVTPKLTVGGNNVTNGQTTYNEDTIQIKYSATLNKVTAKAIVNAGVYKISIGGSSATDAIKATRDGEDTTKNYTISGTDSATYTISKRPITVTWNTSNLKFVYDLSAHGLTVSGINGGGTGAALQSSSLDYAIVKTGYGNDAIKFTLQGKKVDAGNDYEMSIKSSALNGRIVNDEVESTIDNYVISGTTCEKKFDIEKSQIIIKYAGGTTTKVYDAGFGISGTPFEFRTESQNQGADGTSTLFTISYVYTDKNVGDNKEVAFTYVFKQNANYEYVGTGSESKNVGQITPAHIKVALNKLRSGKATRTFTNNVWYGGQAGASGNVNSKVYRSGEGFTVSGVLSSDAIKVVAEYREADDLRNGTGNSFDLSSYVNDVVKNADGTFDKAENAGTHFKTLVFTMTGADAKNYTFNVYNKLGTDGKKYSEKDSTAGDTQTITVYDSRDTENKHQNASGAEKIQIEITVKSVRVDYGNAYQSYANADNTYNTNWNPIIATSQDITAADGTIDVVNNWMYENNDPSKPKREYHGYTTIRGSEKSTVLGATVSKDKGMNFNFRLINQPVLTIAYIVENNGVYEIDTLARLLIASFYYTAHQNPGDQIFMQIVQSGYKWFEVVNGEDYSQVDFAVPEGSPITVDDTIKTWDAYINALNEKGYVVFYNETEKAWGCYVSDSSQSTSLPSSYKLTKDISGKFTADDIKVLDAFFTVTTTDGNGQFTTTKYTWSGEGSDYLKNVLSAAVDKVATINGSLFVSQKAEGAAAITGFDGTFDGNGYVIEYLNIMGYGKDNVGLFDVIGANGIVKNLHLRNVTINGNAKYVGGIAGKVLAAADALTEKSVKNVSFHGSINVTGSTDQSVGGLFGASERAVENTIVLGSITVSNVNAKVGGVVGTLTASLSNVVSMMQITASGGTVGAFTSDNANIGEKCTHMTNAVWKRPTSDTGLTSGTGFVNVGGKNVSYNALMSGSNSLYANGMSDSGTYDVISETFADSGQNVNPRQSKRLRDMVSVYLLMYSLSANGGTYTISSSSWLVGTADGTDNNKIVIANKQNVSLLRELRFAAFVLKANVSIDIASTFSGAFYGSVTSAVNESGVSYDYKITCNKQMFEAYATTTQAWLEVKP